MTTWTVGTGGSFNFSTIQAAINVAGSGDTITVSTGSYNETVTLKSGITLVGTGADESAVVINGSMVVPATLADTTVGNLTVHNGSSTSYLLDMRGTTDLTDVVFHDVTFALVSNFLPTDSGGSHSNDAPIGISYARGSITLHDGADADSAGLTFRDVTMASNDHMIGTANELAMLQMQSAGGAKLVLDGLDLSGMNPGTATLGAQFNISGNGAADGIEIVDSHTSGGGNFYVSGFESAVIDGNTFDGQGLALNGVKHATVTDNIFQNIDDTITANGSQHRGLVIEDAWGTDGVTDVTVTGNTFQNIDSVDGTIAFQRFTDGSPANTATVARLNDVDVHGNTFTDLGTGVNPVYLNPTYFGAGAVLPASFHDAQLMIGTSGADSIGDVSTGSMSIFADAGNDTITGGAGNDAIYGGAGSDVAIFSGAHTGYDTSGLSFAGGVASGTISGTDGADSLSGIEVLKFADGFYVLGGMSIQAAINAAQNGDTIFIGAGHFREQLTINGKDVTIQGAGAGQTIIESPDAAALVSNASDSNASRPTKYAVVTVKGDADATITGVTVDGRDQGSIPSPPTNYDFLGIYVLNSDAHVDGVAVTGADELAGPDVSGIQRNHAILVTSHDVAHGGTGAHTVEIENSTVSGFQKNGIFVNGSTLTANIHDNTIIGTHTANTAQNGIQIGSLFGAVGDGDFSGTHATVDHNTITGIGNSGPAGSASGIIVFAGDASGVSITNNTVTGWAPAQADPANSGNSGISFADSNGGTVTGNTISGFDYGLIELNQFGGHLTTPFTHSGNTFTGNYAANVALQPDTTTGITFAGSAGHDELHGGSGNDVLSGLAGSDTIVGGAGTDTAAGYDASYHIAIQSGHWVVTNGSDTDQLTGVEKVVINGTTYLLVDQFGANGGYQHVQDAINAASGAATILIAPGTYTESGSDGIGHTVGLYINKANLTLQGVDANGAAITTSAGAVANGATIISGHQTGFGANHWVDFGGDNTVIQGLHLQAGTETNNKLLEIWGNNVTVENNFIDIYKGGTVDSQAAAVYLNDNGTTSSEIDSYAITGNVLNGMIVVANGVGDPSTHQFGATQLITNNHFQGAFDYNTGLGRYSDVVLNGQSSGTPWLLAPTQIPTITGNTFSDNSTPIILRGLDDDRANFPTVGQVDQILAANGNNNTTYAYVIDPSSGLLRTDDPFIGGSPVATHRFIVANSINTLNLALDTTPDAVFGGQRGYIHNGDTVVVQSGATGTVNSALMVDNLTVKATVHSTDLNLTLATQFVDGSAIPNGGVHNVTLTDYAAGLGANVDVTGNALANVIVGNSGANRLDGGSGNDVIQAGGGNDAILYAVGGGVDTLDGGSGSDTLFVSGTAGNDSISVVVNGSGVVTSIQGMSPTSVESYVVDAGTGTDTLSYAGTTSAVSVNLGAGSATGFTSASGIENVTGGSAGDSLTGDSNANTFTGGGGNDTIVGGSGIDTAAYTATINTSGITDDGAGHFVVATGGSEGTDTLSGVEKIDGAGTSNILLVGNGGYATIQAAVDAAVDGDTIEIAAGTYTEDVTITGKSITIDGVETGGVNNVTINGQITVAGTLNGALSITDLNINATGKSYGVFVSAASAGFAGSVTLDDVAISNARSNGFAYIRVGNGSTPTLGDTIGAVSILNSEFSNNATATGGNGRGDILLFGYNQDLTISNVTIGSPGAFAQKAIQMRGVQDGGDVVNAGPYDPAGDVAITNLTITGTYAQDLIAFYRIASFGSFTTSGVDLHASAPWGLFNFDEVGGVIDLSTGLSATTANLSPGGAIVVEQGLATADTFTGTAGSDRLTGRGDNDVLDGRAGADAMAGGLGNDTYVVDNPGDVVTEALNEGTSDTVQSSIGYTLGANVENLTLTGSANIIGTGNGDANVITGNSGNNTLDGQGGADTMLGGLGNDTYVVDNAGDVVTEAFNGGTDTVQSSVSRTLSANVENLILTGSADINGTGNGLANTITGNSGNNTLDGGAGADTMIGGLGNDTYVVDNAGDVVTEGAGAGTGTDTVQSSISYTLGANVENLTLTGSANINGTGNGDANVITGNSGNNILAGGAGNDTYVVQNAGDVVTEALNEGIDTVQSSVSYTLGANVENLTLTGSADINGTGNGDANVITGNSGNNVLTGSGGNDTLVGGSGTDTAAYTATITAAAVTEAGGQFVVTTGGAEGTDTLSGIEKIDGAGSANILLVGHGGYASIQAAINAAAVGDTIVIAAGTYNENVVVDKGVTLVGLGEVTVHGTFESDNAVTGNLSDWIATAPSFNGAAGNGVTIAADNVTLSNINIDGFLYGVRFASDVSNTTLTNVDVSNSVIGIEKSIGADVNGLTVNGGSFTDGYIGIDFAKDTGAGQANNGLATNVTISGTHFEDMTAKGIYVEALSSSLITGVTMDHVGFYGGGAAFGGPAAVGGSGIEVNLKNGVYHDVTITNFTLTDTGVSNGAGSSHDNAAAISVKTRDDAPSYNGTPATWTGDALVISNGTIDGTSTGIRAGETNKNVAGPPVDVSGVTITDALHDSNNGDVENLSQSDLMVIGTSGADTYLASPQSTGDIVFHGGLGVDTLTGGGGNDTFQYVVGDGADVINGGAGSDTLDYTGTASVVTVDLGANTATGITGSGGSITSIENVVGGSAGDTLVGSNGDNTFTGGGGNDTVTGGGGNDTAAYTTALALPVSNGDGTWTVNGGSEGTDTLTGIEFIEHSGGRYVLIDPLNPDGGFASVQAAVDAGAGTQPGDTFVFAAEPTTDVEINLTTNDDLEFTIPYNVPTEVHVTGTGSAHVTTGSGDDFIVTDDGADEVHTGDGNDVVQTGGGDDAIIGGQGGGDDIYDGGIGSNTVSYPSATNPVTIDLNAIDRSGQSTLGGTTIGALLTGAGYAANTAVGYAQGVDIGTDVLIDIDNATGGSGADTITGNADANVLSGGLGNDTITAGAGNDTINYTVGDGVDTIDGGADTDTLAVTGTSGDDSIEVVLNGSGVVTSIEGMTPTNVESYSLDGLGNGAAGDTLEYTGTTSAVTVNLGASSATGFTSAANIENVAGGSSGDSLTGTGGANVLSGGGGDDTLTGAGGNDTLAGGSGTDTAVYTGTITSANVTAVADTDATTPGAQPGWQVSAGAEGTDTLTGIEKIDNAGANILLVGNGGYATIQEAINAASTGDTIMVAAGTYAENITIDEEVTLLGLGDVTIQGTFKSLNGLAANASVADFLKTSTTDYVGGAGTGISIAADNVTIQNINISGYDRGILLGNVDHVRIENVDIDATVNGIRKGTGAEVNDLDLIGGSISDSYNGMYISKETADGLDLNDVLISGTSFSHLVEKGIYAETLSNALITGITMSDVGQYGRGSAPVFHGGATQNIGGFGGGIDINLKWDHESTTDTVDDNAPYSNITIQNFTFIDVGASNKDGTAASHSGGAAIAVKARDSGSYASPEQASFLGAVIIQNGTIDGTSTGIRAGEPGQNIAGPSVTVTDVTITDAVHNSLHGDIDNVNQSTMTVNLDDDGNTLVPHASATGSFVVNGGDGVDNIAGGANADTLNGGAGNDTLDGSAGADTMNGGIGNDTYVVDNAGDSVTEASNEGTTDTVQSSVSFTLGVNVENLTLTGSDNIDGTGNGDANIITGNSGNNVLTGAGGGDTLVGGSGTDTAGYTAGITASMVADDGLGHFVVATGGSEGTDTLSGIEKIDGAGSSNILLVGNGGYATIQAAVDAAAAGDTIIVGVGTFAGADITKELTIIGQGAGQTIITTGSLPTPGVGFQLTGDIDATSGGSATVTIQGFSFVANSVGVRVRSNANLDHLVISDSHFENNTSNGVGMGSGAPLLGAIDIIDSTFTNNGAVASGTSANGSGDISLFNFHGDALIQNVTVHGGDNAVPNATNANFGIQVAGFDPNTHAVANAIGNVVFDNVSVTGAYSKTLAYVQGYIDLDGLTFLNTGTSLNGAAGWGMALVVDPTSDQTSPLFDEAGAAALAPDIIDLSNVTAVNSVPVNVPSGHPLFAYNGTALAAVIDGTPVADQITGTSGIDAISGNEGNDTLNGGAGNDTLDGGAGADTMSGGIGNDTYIVDNAGDTATEALSEGTADTVQSSVSFTLGANVENLTLTGSGNVDGAGNGDANVITGNSGNNVLTGGGGNDTLVGNAGTDTAGYTASITAAMVASDGLGHFVVSTGGAEGTDTLSGIEKIDSAGSANILLVGNGGYATIQEAINAAAAGDTIMVAAGTYSENLSITKGLSLVAVGAVVLQPAAGNAVVISGDLNGADVSITGFEIVGTTSAPNQGIGVHVQHADVGTLTLDNVNIHGAGAYGVFVEGGSATDAAAEVVITDSTFSNNGANGTNGSSHIKLWGFDGDALIQNVTITGSADGTPVAQRPDYGIELTGQPNPVSSPTVPIGNVTIDNVTVTGEFHKNGVAVFNYGNIDGLDIGGTGDVDLSGVETDWGPVFNIDGITADVDASGFDLTLPASAIIHTELQGDKLGQDATAQTITGTDSNDRLIGKGGNDVLHGGQGNDELYGADKPGEPQEGDAGSDTLVGDAGNDMLNGGAGNDTLDGGTGTDTAVYTTTLALGDVVASGGGWTVNGGAAGTDALSNVEIVQHAGGRYLLVGNGGFADATAAAAAATHAGDILVFATAPGGPVDIDLGGTDEDLDVTIPGDTEIDITTGDGDSHITVGGGDNEITTGDGDNEITTGDGNNQIATGDGNNQITTGDGNNEITTGDGNNEIVTGNGNNDVTTGGGDDHVTTGGGADTIHTGDGDDIVHAGGGDDAIVGGQGGGNDFYDGGSGVNTVEYPSATNSITIDLNEVDRSGDPLIGGALGAVLTAAALPTNTPIGYARGVDIGIDVLINIQNATGGSGNDTITGNSFNNILDGGIGADSLTGGAGNDTYVVDNIGDVVTEAAGQGTDTVQSSIDYTLGTNVENLTLTGAAFIGTGNDGANVITGNAGINVLFGLGGDDTLVSGGGADAMIGGLGNDTYVVQHGGEGIYENANEGIDTVMSSAHYRLSGNVENLTLQGSADLQAYGNSLANTIIGNAGNNILDGDVGADVMSGGSGNDVYFVDNGSDQVIENASEGNDTVFSTTHLRLAANVENLILQGSADLQAYGNSSVNAIFGNTGNNILDGDAGADVMLGGSGNDVYFVDNAGDMVIENASEGNDLVFSTAHLRLSDNVEYLILQGSADLQGYGNNLANIIIGNAGNNILNGDAGVDAMFGGAGNDAYFVDNAGDVAIENPGEGNDIVFSTAHFQLSENVETLVLQGSADLQGYGNSQANTLYGNTGNNLLNGEGGADTMIGGAGNDVYFVDDAGDLVFEGLNQGTDAVFATVNYTLSANVETLVLQGSGNLTGTGNALDNKLYGNAGDNTLDGGNGADMLNGGAGHDTRTGGLGNDTFVFRAGEADGDIVVDFDGQGAAAGDSLQFVGYGAGATFTNIDATHWQVNFGGSSHEVITFMNGAPIDPTDFLFS